MPIISPASEDCWPRQFIRETLRVVHPGGGSKPSRLAINAYHPGRVPKNPNKTSQRSDSGDTSFQTLCFSQQAAANAKRTERGIWAKNGLLCSPLTQEVEISSRRKQLTLQARLHLTSHRLPSDFPVFLFTSQARLTS